MIYLETGSQDPCYNLAFEEYVLCHRLENDYLLLWQNEKTIVIGTNQNAAAEINRGFVEANGIQVVRRCTGGGAVYHDLGNLNYSFITDAGNVEMITMERFTKPIVAALRGLGLQAEASGRNDILVNGRKISGTAQRLAGGRILHHGTLLFDVDPAMVSGALNADPSKFQSKSAKSVRSRIGNIRDFLKEDMTLEQFWDYLKTCLSRGGLEPGCLNPEELRGVEKLKNEKYDTWEWNFGRSPHYTFSNRCRWDGGSLEVQAEVKQGKVIDIAFYGDFMASDRMTPLIDALLGCNFTRQSFAEILERFPLALYFGTIGTNEILETVFPAE